MNHLNEDRLLEYILETHADDAERAEMAEHLSLCPECRSQLEALREDIKIIGSIRPLQPVLRIPGQPVRSGFVYGAVRAAALIIFGVAAGFCGSLLVSRQPAAVSPVYIVLSPPPDSVSSYVIADATSISAEFQQ